MTLRLRMLPRYPVIGIDGVWANTTAVVTGTRAITIADKGKTLVLGGNALYTATVADTTTLGNNWMTVVVNADTWAAGRAKRIASTSGDFDTFFLWPGQTKVIYKANGTLRCDPDFERAKVANGTVFNCQFGTGSDTLGDGLGSGATAFNTIQSAYFNALSYLDLANAQIQIKMLASQLDTGATHLAPHGGPPGVQGGAGILLDGNGALYRSTGSNFELYHGCVLQIKNLILQSTAATPNLSVNRGAYLYLLNDMVFNGNTGNADIGLSDGGTVELANSFTVGGLNARSYFISNGGGTVRASAAINGTITADQAVTQWVIGQDGGVTDIANVTWINPSVVSGQKYSLFTNHVLRKSATLPGTVAGSTASGGQAV